VVAATTLANVDWGLEFVRAEGRATFLDDNNNVVFAYVAAVRGRWEIFGRGNGDCFRRFRH